MSLPLSTVVDVQIAIAPKPIALQSFGKMVFVTDETPTTPALNRIVSYSDLEGVGEDWAVTSEVYKAATAFYGQGAHDFMVCIAAATATPAILSGGPVVLADIQAVTAGGFTISINGAVQNITALDFSGATDLAAAATILQAALTGTTVAASADFLTITTVMTGSGASITAATADIQGAAAALGIITGEGVVTPASVPELPLEALVAAQDIDPSFYGIVLHKKWRDGTNVMPIAEFAQASRKVFFNTSNNVDVLNPAITTDVMSELKAASMQRTLSHYSSHPEQYPSAAVAGRAFLVNFEGTNTTITLNLKVIKGVTVEELTTSQKAALEGKNGNAVVNLAGTFVYSDSRMGDGTWFDAVHGVDWLQNRVETGIFNRMYTTTTKIPYTDTGVTILIHEVEQALRQGVTNGLLAPGNNLNGEYLPLGYRITYIPTAQVSQADKGNRVYKGISFECVGAGAMHKVVVNGTFNE